MDDELLRKLRELIRKGIHQAATSGILAEIDERLASGGWIKTSERLPTEKDADENGEVWVWKRGRTMAWKWSVEEVASCAHAYSAVGLFWQPLPALPKGE